MSDYLRLVGGQASIRVAVVDDRDDQGGGPAELLAVVPEIAVVGRSGPGLQVIDMVRRTAPEIVVVDLAAPGARLATLARLSAGFPQVSVLLVVSGAGPDQLEAAAQIGIGGCAPASATQEALAELIRRISRGEQSNWRP